MFGNQYYYGITRKAIIAFGSIFNDLYIMRDSNLGKDHIEQTIRVPITFCNKQKFERVIRGNPNKEVRQFAIELPRLAFEILDYEYDPSQKTQSNTNINKYLPTVNSGTGIGIPTPTGTSELLGQYAPSPYLLTFKLYAATTNISDMYQIWEQIAATFNPHYSIKVKWIPELGLESDFPITLTSVSPSDSFDGVLNDRREIIWEFTFTAQVKYYGPTTSRKVIKHVRIPLHTDFDSMPDDWDEKLLADVVPEDAEITDDYVITQEIIKNPNK